MTPQAPREAETGLITLITTWVRQALCPHLWVRSSSHERIYLVCVACGKETHGFIVHAPRP